MGGRSDTTIGHSAPANAKQWQSNTRPVDHTVDLSLRWYTTRGIRTTQDPTHKWFVGCSRTNIYKITSKTVQNSRLTGPRPYLSEKYCGSWVICVICEVVRYLTFFYSTQYTPMMSRAEMLMSVPSCVQNIHRPVSIDFRAGCKNLATTASGNGRNRVPEVHLSESSLRTKKMYVTRSLCCRKILLWKMQKPRGKVPANFLQPALYEN